MSGKLNAVIENMEKIIVGKRCFTGLCRKYNTVYSYRCISQKGRKYIMKEYTIGEFAKIVGAHKETIRYYELLGIN